MFNLCECHSMQQVYIRNLPSQWSLLQWVPSQVLWGWEQMPQLFSELCWMWQWRMLALWEPLLLTQWILCYAMQEWYLLTHNNCLQNVLILSLWVCGMLFILSVWELYIWLLFIQWSMYWKLSTIHLPLHLIYLLDMCLSLLVVSKSELMPHV